MEDKTESATSLPSAALTEEAIVAYLEQNPDFLLRHPDAARLLTPPARRTGNDVVDFTRFLVDRLRADISALRSRERKLIATVEENADSQSRVYRATLALIRLDSPAALVRVVREELPSILQIQAASLCHEPGADTALGGKLEGAVVLDRGAMARLGMPARGALLRRTTADDRSLFPAEAGDIGSVAVMPIALSRAQPPALLALGAARADGYHAGQATDLLTFLARVTEGCLKRWMTAST